MVYLNLLAIAGDNSFVAGGHMITGQAPKLSAPFFSANGH